MKRNRKIVINLLIIFLVAAVHFKTWGIYLSAEKCVEKSLYELYFSFSEQVNKAKYDKGIYYAYINQNEELAIHGAKRVFGIFYMTSGGFTGNSMHPERELDFHILMQDNTLIIFVKRNMAKIKKAVICWKDGTELTIDDWDNNTAMIAIDVPDSASFYYDGTIKGYDDGGKLVFEKDTLLW